VRHVGVAGRTPRQRSSSSECRSRRSPRQSSASRGVSPGKCQGLSQVPGLPMPGSTSGGAAMMAALAAARGIEASSAAATRAACPGAAPDSIGSNARPSREASVGSAANRTSRQPSPGARSVRASSPGARRNSSCERTGLLPSLLPSKVKGAERRSCSAGPEYMQARSSTEPAGVAPAKPQLISRRTFSFYGGEEAVGSLQSAASAGQAAALQRREPAEVPRRPPPIPGTHITESSPRRPQLAPRPPSVGSSRQSSPGGRSGSELSTATPPRSILRGSSVERSPSQPKRVTFAKDCKAGPPASMADLLALCRTGSEEKIPPTPSSTRSPPRPPDTPHRSQGMAAGVSKRGDGIRAVLTPPSLLSTQGRPAVKQLIAA